LKKKVQFALTTATVHNVQMLVITVDNRDVSAQYRWNPDKFQNRLFLFREMLDDYLDDGILQKFGTPDKDPFWDPPVVQNAYPEKKKVKAPPANV